MHGPSMGRIMKKEGVSLTATARPGAQDTVPRARVAERGGHKGGARGLGWSCSWAGITVGVVGSAWSPLASAGSLCSRAMALLGFWTKPRGRKAVRGAQGLVAFW